MGERGSEAMKRRMIGGAGLAAMLTVAGYAQAPAPETIDLVYGRLVEQGRALDAVAKIVEQLELVAAHPEATKALLSDQGEPIERLRRALNDVATRRGARLAEETVSAPAARVGMDRDVEARMDEQGIAVVYAETGRGGGRVVFGALGAYFPAGPGQTVRIGEDFVEVVDIRTRPDGGVDVEVRVNGGIPFVKRAGS